MSGEKGQDSARGHLLYIKHPPSPTHTHTLFLSAFAQLSPLIMLFFFLSKPPIVFLLASPPFTFPLFPSVPCLSAMALCFGLGPCLLLWCMTLLFSAHVCCRGVCVRVCERGTQMLNECVYSVHPEMCLLVHLPVSRLPRQPSARLRRCCCPADVAAGVTDARSPWRPR